MSKLQQFPVARYLSPFLQQKQSLDFLRLSSVEQIHFFRQLGSSGQLDRIELSKDCPSISWEDVILLSYPDFIHSVANSVTPHGAAPTMSGSDSNNTDTVADNLSCYPFVRRPDARPSLEIELLWRVHCLNPQIYFSDCMKRYGRIIPRPQALLSSCATNFSNFERYESEITFSHKMRQRWRHNIITNIGTEDWYFPPFLQRYERMAYYSKHRFANINLWMALRRQNQFARKMVNLTASFFDSKTGQNREFEQLHLFGMYGNRTNGTRCMHPTDSNNNQHASQPCLMTSEDIQDTCLRRYLQYMCLISLQQQQAFGIDWSRRRWLTSAEISEIDDIKNQRSTTQKAQKTQTSQFIEKRFHLVPPLDVDLMWHSHCLDPVGYHKFSKDLFGLDVVIHNDNIKDELNQERKESVHAASALDTEPRAHKSVSGWRIFGNNQKSGQMGQVGQEGVDVLRYDRICSERAWQHIFGENYHFDAFRAAAAKGSERMETTHANDWKKRVFGWDRKKNFKSESEGKNESKHEEQERRRIEMTRCFVAMCHGSNNASYANKSTMQNTAQTGENLRSNVGQEGVAAGEIGVDGGDRSSAHAICWGDVDGTMPKDIAAEFSADFSAIFTATCSAACASCAAGV